MSIKDFDAYWAEQERKPIEFKLFGQVETLPPSLPATMILKMVRAQREYGNKDLPESVQLDLAFSVFGEDKVQEWCDKGLTIEQLGDLMKWATEQFNPGNAKAPKKGEKKG